MEGHLNWDYQYKIFFNNDMVAGSEQPGAGLNREVQ